MCNNQQCIIVFVMPFRLKSHIRPILVLDRLQCVARVNCLVIIIQYKHLTSSFFPTANSVDSFPIDPMLVPIDLCY